MAEKVYVCVPVNKNNTTFENFSSIASPPIASPPIASPPIATPLIATPLVATPLKIADEPTPVQSIASPPIASPPIASPPIASPPIVSLPTAQGPMIDQLPLILPQLSEESKLPAFNMTYVYIGLCVLALVIVVYFMMNSSKSEE